MLIDPEKPQTQGDSEQKELIIVPSKQYVTPSQIFLDAISTKYSEYQHRKQMASMIHEAFIPVKDPETGKIFKLKKKNSKQHFKMKQM